MTAEIVASPGLDAAPGQARRYTSVAMALHWAVAVLILTQLGVGWYMNSALVDHSPAQDRVQELHVSIGLTAMILVLARVAWRLITPPPPLPSAIPGWERKLANTVHVLLYAMILIMPFSGWLFRTIREHTLPFWGLVWPQFPGIDSIIGNRKYSSPIAAWHEQLFAYILTALIAVHVAGAIRHQFDGHPVLWRMVPFLKPPKREEGSPDSGAG